MAVDANVLIFERIKEELKVEKNNIFVRGMRPYNLNSYLRITIGEENEMEKLLDSLLEFLGNAKK